MHFQFHEVLLTSNMVYENRTMFIPLLKLMNYDTNLTDALHYKLNDLQYIHKIWKNEFHFSDLTSLKEIHPID